MAKYVAKALSVGQRAAQQELATKFRNLHIPGNPVVLSNIWNVATANSISSLPTTKALATASFAFAAQNGLQDEELTAYDNFVAIEPIGRFAISSKIPLSVDLQDGYQDLEENIRTAIRLGAVGCNLEDLSSDTGELRTKEEACSRVERALAAAREEGITDFVINARTDVVVKGGTIDDAIDRARAFLQAGATTVYVWGGPSRGLRTHEVERLVAELKGMVNVKANISKADSLTVSQLKAMGVARVSIGPELYRAAMASIEAAAKRMMET